MKDFDHVVLTRFSVTFAPEQPTPDDAWLQYRLGFFIEATMASLRSQTDTDFVWLVFFDDRAPDWLREAVAELSPGRFEPVWITGPFGLHHVRAAIAPHLTRSHLVTTRLDSDDALATDFVASIAREFDNQDDIYINFLRGVQIDRTGQVFQFDYPANPFISYVEKRTADTEPQTVLRSFRHMDAVHLSPTLNIAGPPTWLQVVHGANLMNNVRGRRVHPRAVSHRFSIDLGYTTEVSPVTLMRERAQQQLRLFVLWVRQPSYLKVSLWGSLLHRRGNRIAQPRRKKSD